MRNSGKLAAAIEILAAFGDRRVPMKTAMADWGRANRYAGAKDRAWISGLCLDALRKRSSIQFFMGDSASRALAIGTLRLVWGWSVEEIDAAAREEPHGIGGLSALERAALEKTSIDKSAPAHVLGDFPDWMSPSVIRVFGEGAVGVVAKFADRADIDLRANTLKASTEQALKAVAKINGESAGILTNAIRIPAPPADQRGASVTVIPAFNKGWVEVQDLGSQIAAAAAGDIMGSQVLDYCAGGGGKTLALAAMMKNTGQLYAYDRDPRRLKPLFHRAKRAGLRNLQIRSPAGTDGMDDLKGKMDVVFVDAPCSGTGTWRRHPDTKWRLTEQQLKRRIDEQNVVLGEAAQFVKPGGRLIWVTCSFLMEENEDRLNEFLSNNVSLARTSTIDSLTRSGVLSDDGVSKLSPCETPEKALRLTPDKIRADGFFIANLEKKTS